MLARWGDERPAWSVCGQDMCSCLPTASIEPACPLCETGLGDAEGCTTGSVVGGSGERAPILRTMSDADDAACSMMVAMFVFMTAQRSGAEWQQGNDPRWLIEAAARPACDPIGVPTPPPRRA